MIAITVSARNSEVVPRRASMGAHILSESPDLVRNIFRKKTASHEYFRQYEFSLVFARRHAYDLMFRHRQTDDADRNTQTKCRRHRRYAIWDTRSQTTCMVPSCQLRVDMEEFKYEFERTNVTLAQVESNFTGDGPTPGDIVGAVNDAPVWVAITRNPEYVVDVTRRRDYTSKGSRANCERWSAS